MNQFNRWIAALAVSSLYDEPSPELLDEVGDELLEMLSLGYWLFILAWTGDAVSGYMLDATVYGLVLTAAGSVALAGADLLGLNRDTGRGQDSPTDNILLSRVKVGLGMFISGFSVQFAIELASVSLNVNKMIPLAPGTLNIFLGIAWLPLIWQISTPIRAENPGAAERIENLLRLLARIVISSVVILGAVLVSAVIFGAPGIVYTVAVFAVLTIALAVFYVLHWAYSRFNSAHDLLIDRELKARAASLGDVTNIEPRDGMEFRQWVENRRSQ